VSPIPLLALQIGMSFVVFGAFAAWVARPAIAGWSSPRTLQLLLWIHVFRFVPLALYAPGQVAADIAPVAIDTVAWGDFASSVLALLALAAFRTSSRSGVAATWLFSVASVIDIVVALVVALSHGVHTHALGVGWFVLILYVPLVCVSQAMIFSRLTGTSR
jgi:hypothetical protein